MPLVQSEDASSVSSRTSNNMPSNHNLSRFDTLKIAGINVKGVLNETSSRLRIHSKSINMKSYKDILINNSKFQNRNKGKAIADV